jgi:drug/metabolite transporter (DMT)-like permease
MSDDRSRPYVLMLCGSFSFTIMAELAHVLTRECDWPVVAIARSVLAAAFAGLLAYLAGAKLVFFRPLRLWIRSIAGSCSMVCTFFAFAKLPAVDVLTLTNTFPLWVAILCWPLYGHAPNWKVWLAVAAGILGVALIEQPHLEAGNWGAIAALAAAVFTAIAMLGLHSLREIDPLAIVVHFSTVATVFCVAAFLIVPTAFGPIKVDDGLMWLKLLAMGLSATIGQIFLTRAFGSGAPAKVSVVGLTQIVFVFVFDVILWGHEVNTVALIGTALVLAPTAWVLLHSEEGNADEAEGTSNALTDTKEETVPDVLSKSS